MLVGKENGLIEILLLIVFQHGGADKAIIADVEQKRASEEQVRNKSGASEEQVKHIYKNDKECNKNDKERKKEPAAPLFDEEDDTEGIDLWGEDDDTVIRS